MMEAMTDCQKDEAAAVPKIDKHLATTSGQKRPRNTTVGWLLVKWVRVLDSVERSEGVTPNQDGRVC
jgi:hypothetical protein